MNRLKSYYKYWRSRTDAHGIHSPFVFDFYNSVLLQAEKVNDASIQRIVKKLKTDQRQINVSDYGAGSKRSNTSVRKVATIAKTAGINRKYGQLLTRLSERYCLENATELGTSLGIGTMYLSQCNSIKQVITIEGSNEIALIAQDNFLTFQAKNITSIIGKFDENLVNALPENGTADLIFIDGNHRYQPTLDYFNFFIDRLSENGFIIFDDIHWSQEMEKAWKEIYESPKINVSMDLYRMGIVCKRPGQAKQHFVLKY